MTLNAGECCSYSRKGFGEKGLLIQLAVDLILEPIDASIVAEGTALNVQGNLCGTCEREREMEREDV